MRPYPEIEKQQISRLVTTLTALVERDPEQEVQGIALPVLDAVIGRVRDMFPDDPVVQSVADVISPEQIASGEPVRAADALLVAQQLDATIGEPPLVNTIY